MEEGDAQCSEQKKMNSAVSDVAPTVQPAGATPSYFDDPVAAKKLREEAVSWIGTPFREYYQQLIEHDVDLKGMGGGIDCIGLVQEIFSRIGASHKFLFAREDSDYQTHGLGDKVLDWLRGKADDPQSKILSEIFTELEFPEIIKDPKATTPMDFFKPGDILVMQHGGLFHMPVIYDNQLHFVNAVPRRGVIEGTIQDGTYARHLVAVFRLKPRPKVNVAQEGFPNPHDL